MPRVRLYSLPHRGLRHAFNIFVSLAGTTNYTVIEEVERLKTVGDELFTLLKDHADNEEEYLLKPLEKRYNGGGQDDFAEHILIEKEQDDLKNALSELNGTQDNEYGHRFYLQCTHFQGHYLEHIFKEETITEPLLQKYFTDEELLKLDEPVRAKVALATLLLWLKYIAPATGEIENTVLFKQMKAVSPPDLFDSICNVIKPAMGEKAFISLMSKIG